MSEVQRQVANVKLWAYEYRIRPARIVAGVRKIACKKKRKTGSSRAEAAALQKKAGEPKGG